ncbi:hypothetical protein [Shimazuella soli]
MFAVFAEFERNLIQERFAVRKIVARVRGRPEKFGKIEIEIIKPLV